MNAPFEIGDHVQGSWDCAKVVDLDPTKSEVQVLWCERVPGRTMTWRKDYTLRKLTWPVCCA